MTLLEKIGMKENDPFEIKTLVILFAFFLGLEIVLVGFELLAGFLVFSLFKIDFIIHLLYVLFGLIAFQYLISKKPNGLKFSLIWLGIYVLLQLNAIGYAFYRNTSPLWPTILLIATLIAFVLLVWKKNQFTPTIPPSAPKKPEPTGGLLPSKKFIGVAIVLTSILTVFGVTFFLPALLAEIYASYVQSLKLYYFLSIFLWLIIFELIHLARNFSVSWIRQIAGGILVVLLLPTIIILLFNPVLLVENPVASFARIYNPNFNIPLFTWPTGRINEEQIVSMWTEKRENVDWRIMAHSDYLFMEPLEGGPVPEETFKHAMLGLIKNEKIKQMLLEFEQLPTPPYGYIQAVQETEKIIDGQRVTIKTNYYRSDCIPEEGAREFWDCRKGMPLEITIKIKKT